VEFYSEMNTARFQFGRRAAAYARSSVLGSREDLEIVVDLALAGGGVRVLDVATGTGNLAFVLAERGGVVVGLDLTREMLEEACSILRERRELEVSFLLGEVGCLPFREGVFDAVTCRFSFHHFQAPEKALAEMRRVCKSGGRIVVEDIVSPEEEAGSKLQNRMEKIRDPSHIRHYKKSELEALALNAGLEVLEIVERGADFRLEEWLDIADPPREKRGQVKKLMFELREELRLRLQDGEAWFTYPVVVLAATSGSSRSL